MNIGLLLCDDVHPELQKIYGNYPEMFATLLQQVEPSIELTTWRLIDMEFPSSVDECDGWIISGSKHGANDDLPWIAPLEAFVRVVFEQKKKLVGICFGHQIIAKALGGEVVRASQGWGVGMSDNAVFSHPEWMQPDCTDFKLLVSHQDQVTSVPDSGAVLAGSTFCPNWMIQYDNCLLGIQGHPEFTREFSRSLLDLRRHVFGEDVYVRGLEALSDSTESQLVAQWVINFFRVFEK
ncbi:glutamine amidotransferase-related protein [Endozoicomonas ascidiicola]|uniref:glutamine amidotransferase-related protein n=1 Tax=Endozoicomonas ascidiicola TaxID=1698521 RepID=UPI0008303B96|nr:GMP synthase [Endozoicomonas ascidiicola]